MLGRVVRDPLGLEGPAGEAPGLGLLDVETVLEGRKTVRETGFVHVASEAAGQAYEIHLGRTEGADRARAPFRVDDRGEGAASPDGRVVGSYLHGVFASDSVRAAWLAAITGAPLSSGTNYEGDVEATLDRLAAHLARHLDIEALLALAHRRPAPG